MTYRSPVVQIPAMPDLPALELSRDGLRRLAHKIVAAKGLPIAKTNTLSKGQALFVLDYAYPNRARKGQLSQDRHGRPVLHFGTSAAITSPQPDPARDSRSKRPVHLTVLLHDMIGRRERGISLRFQVRSLLRAMFPGRDPDFQIVSASPLAKVIGKWFLNPVELRVWR